MEFILALDQGTTSSRALLFDRGGALRSVAQRDSIKYFLSRGGSSTTLRRFGVLKSVLPWRR
jgi:glycerol kinase